MDNEKVQELLTAVGAMSEMCHAFYDAALKQHFTPIQAMALTQTMLQAMILKPMEGPRYD